MRYQQMEQFYSKRAETLLKESKAFEEEIEKKVKEKIALREREME